MAGIVEAVTTIQKVELEDHFFMTTITELTFNSTTQIPLNVGCSSMTSPSLMLSMSAFQRRTCV